MTCLHFAQFVGADFCHGGFVRRIVALDRNLRGHAAHRERTAAMAGLDQ
jgi:hypothetical protein